MTQSDRYAVVSLIALGLATPALAQAPQNASSPAPTGAPNGREREVVIVTVNKREEPVQDIAVVVTAVTSNERQEIGLTTMQDLTNFIPGLSYTQGVERVYLRGIGRNTNNFGSEPGVANYDNGIYTSFATIAQRDPIFVERTEILRAPQGTLYGRNSIGGAINVINKRPEDEFAAEMRLSAGTYGYKRMAASVTGPISDDVRYRVAGAINGQNKGYLANSANGDTEFGAIPREYFIEGQLEANVGDSIDLWWRHENGAYTRYGPPGGRVNAGANIPYQTVAPFANAATNPTYPNFAYGFSVPHTQAGSVTTNPSVTDPRTFNTGQRWVAQVPKYNSDIIEAVWHAPGWDVKYIGGYIYYRYDLTGDLDNNPILSYSITNPLTRKVVPVDARAEFYYQEDRAAFSNELNFISTYEGPLQFLAGLYQYQENYSNAPISLRSLAPSVALKNPVVLTGTSVAPGAPNPTGDLYYSRNIGIGYTYGAFVQGDWQIDDQLKATLGVRYSYDLKKMREDARLICWLACTFSNEGPFALLLTGKNIEALDVTDLYLPGNKLGARGVIGVPATDPKTGVRTRRLEDDWFATTGTAALEWTPVADTLVYAQYTGGYKTGGFRPESMSPSPWTAPEFVDSYELGYKRTIPAWNLTANVAAFYYDYRDAQAPLSVQPAVGRVYTAFINIPKVETTGVELETHWSPIDRFDLLFNYAYLNAEIAEGSGYVNNFDPKAELPNAQPIASLNPASINQNFEGNILPQSPKHKVAINGRYTWNLDAGSLIGSVSWYWRDTFYSSIFNNPFNESKAFDQTDARLIWNAKSGRYTLIGWVRNAFDQTGYENVTAGLNKDCAVGQPARGTPSCSSPNTPLLTTGLVSQEITLTPPRTYGVELQFHF